MGASDAPIQLIAGLGNPGASYAWTRHNAGFWLVDELARQLGLSWKASKRLDGETAAAEVDGRPLRLFKSDEFMNVSGTPVAAACRYYKIPVPGLLLAHDDIDLPSGVVHLKYAGGHGGHNGVRDVSQHLGKEFWRMKIGVGHPELSADVVQHVLKPLSEADRLPIRQAVQRAAAQVGNLAAGDFQAAMNDLHAVHEAPG